MEQLSLIHQETTIFSNFKENIKTYMFHFAHMHERFQSFFLGGGVLLWTFTFTFLMPEILVWTRGAISIYVLVNWALNVGIAR